jgi:hypothetical protein
MLTLGSYRHVIPAMTGDAAATMVSLLIAYFLG